LSKKINFDAYIGASNITGVKYPMMIFANQLPDTYTAAPSEAVIFGGINLKYNF
jgi:iron complex outermembrane receptor protein